MERGEEHKLSEKFLQESNQNEPFLRLYKGGEKVLQEIYQQGVLEKLV